MRCHASAGVELPADPERVWDTVVDWDRQSRWMLLTQARAVSQGGRGVGGRISARTAVGPIGFTDHMVITYWSPPYECRVRHVGRVLRGEGAFRVEPSAGGSRFTWTEDVVLPSLVRPGFEFFMRMSLRRLALEVR